VTHTYVHTHTGALSHEHIDRHTSRGTLPALWGRLHDAESDTLAQAKVQHRAKVKKINGYACRSVRPSPNCLAEGKLTLKPVYSELNMTTTVVRSSKGKDFVHKLYLQVSKRVSRCMNDTALSRKFMFGRNGILEVADCMPCDMGKVK